MPEDVKIMAVVGAGTMGRGIAQLAAQRGVVVRLIDALPEALASAREKIEAGLAEGVAKGKINQGEADRALARVKVAKEYGELTDAGFVVEAVSEDLEIKRKVFAALDAVVAREAVLATNTSSIPVHDIAMTTSHPSRVIGMHFFNPPVAMRLVEIVRHARTAEETFKAAHAFAMRLGRSPVAVKDTAGFLVNRVMRSYYLVAQRLAAEGVGGFAAIDAAVRAQGDVPMGPFELMDFIGVEVNLAITHKIYNGLGKPEHLKPHSLQEKLVEAGCRGRKSGRGFYLYEEDGKKENPEALALLPGGGNASEEEIWNKIMDAIVGEAERVVAEGVATKDGVDSAVRLAMKFPKGPFEWRRTHVD